MTSASEDLSARGRDIGPTTEGTSQESREARWGETASRLVGEASRADENRRGTKRDRAREGARQKERGRGRKREKKRKEKNAIKNAIKKEGERENENAIYVERERPTKKDRPIGVERQRCFKAADMHLADSRMPPA